MVRRIFFCFNAASGTLHKGIRTFFSYRRPKFAIKSFVCSTPYIYVVNSDMQLNNIVVFPQHQWLLERPTMLRYMDIAYFVIHYVLLCMVVF